MKVMKDGSKNWNPWEYLQIWLAGKAFVIKGELDEVVEYLMADLKESNKK